MGIYKLVKNDEAVSRKHNDSYSIKNYLTKDFNKDFSIAVSELNGEHELTKSTASDRIYYFIEGHAEFIINNEIINVNKDDTLYIEKNTEYSFKGNFKAVLINLPAFGIENDVRV